MSLLFGILLLVFVVVRAAESQDKIVVASPILPLTKTKLRLITLSAQLSSASFNQNVFEEFEKSDGGSFQYFESKDEVDAVVTYNSDSYCIVAFRGSRSPAELLAPGNIEDWLSQNLNTKPISISKRQTKKDEDSRNESCSVTEGFYNSYSGVGTERLNQFIDECMLVGKTSTTPAKQLVLTGYSQGGAAACIASIIQADYNPLTITFGQPPFLSKKHNKKCTLLNYQHIWRIINTENSSNGLQYDPIPFVKLLEPVIQAKLFGPQIGSSIHLPPNNEGTVEPVPYSTNVFYRASSQAYLYMDRSNLDISNDKGTELFSAHFLAIYLSKLLFLEQSGPDPIPVDGYIDGTQCQADFECQSFASSDDDGGCIRNVCATEKKQTSIGDFCEEGKDCQTGRCDSTWTGLSKQCYKKKSNGSPCNEDMDCASGRCTWYFICQE